MLGLPSTTIVHVPLPKAAFYRQLKPKVKTRDHFVTQVESIAVVASIKPSTANLADGEHVHEIMLIDVEPKDGEEIAPDVYLTIQKANPHKKLFLCEATGECGVVVGEVFTSAYLQASELELRGRTLDQVWDSLLGQVVYGEPDSVATEQRIAYDHKAEALKGEIDRLEEKSRKATQYVRKNELHDQARAKRRELEELLSRGPRG